MPVFDARMNINREKAFKLTDQISDPLDLYDYIPFRISVVSNLLMFDRDSEIRDITDLGAREIRVLLNIGSYMPIKASDIAYQSRMDSYTVSRAVKSLSGKDLVHQKDDPTNRKNKLLSLSETGVELYRAVTAVANRRGTELDATLSTEQRENLKETLSQLENTIESILATRADQKLEKGLTLSSDQSELIRWHKRSRVLSEE